MQRLFVSLELSTPVILTTPVTLDAILIGELALHVGEEAALADVPLRRREGIPMASQGYMDAVGIVSNVFKICHRRGTSEAAPLDRLRPLRGSVFRREKNILNKYQARSVKAIHFTAVGHPHDIRDLLEDVRSIGVRRADGYGMVSSRTVEVAGPDDASPWALVDGSGEPMRPIPVGLWKTLGGRADPVVQAVRATPPYWDRSRPEEACAVPPDTNPKRVTDLMGLVR